MANATMKNFGYPETLVHEYEHWCVLLRPAQATLGALVLVCKDEAEAFSAITPEAFGELAGVVADIERGLNGFRPYRKINYLMLMMVDRDVHFHVIPRYDRPQVFQGVEFPDPGWPKLPDLGAAVSLDEALRPALVAALKKHWSA